jgi:HEAT repeat protein
MSKVKPRKLNMTAPKMELQLVPGRPTTIPGSNGFLVVEVGDISARGVHLMLYVAGRGPVSESFVLNVWGAREGKQWALVLPDQSYVVRLRDVEEPSTENSPVTVEIGEGLLDDPVWALPVDGRLSDEEEAGIQRIRLREKQNEGQVLRVSWYFCHCAEEDKKLDACRVLFATKDMSDDECDIGKGIRRAGSLENYRKSIVALLWSDDIAVRAFCAFWLGIVGAPESADDLIALVRATDLPVGKYDSPGTDRREAALGLGMLGATQYAGEMATLLQDKNESVRSGAAIALGLMGAKEHTAAIAELLDDDDASPVYAAISALAQLDAKQYSGRIAEKFRPPYVESSIPDAVLYAILEMDAKDQIDTIFGCNTGTTVLAWAVLGARERAPKIVVYLGESNYSRAAQDRHDALLALGILKAKEYAADVCKLLEADEDFVRRAAAWSLILMEDDAYGARALRVLEDEYYGSPIELRQSDLRQLPYSKFVQIQSRAHESLARCKREYAASLRDN